MNLGEYLQKKRKEKGYTQEQLAELVNVDARTIRRIEKNRVSKVTETIQKICDQLNVPKSLIDSNISISLLNSKLSDLNPMNIMKTLYNLGSQEMILNIEASLIKAFNLAKNKDYKEALDTYLALAKIFPKEIFYLACATIYQLIGEHTNAIEFSDKILSLETHKYEAFITKGVSLGSLNDNDGALEAFNCALSINSTFEVNYDIGLCYYYKMDYDKSLYYFKEATKLNPNEYKTYEMLGNCYRDLDQFDDAIKYYEKALKIDSKNYLSLLGIAISHSMKSRFLDAGYYFKILFKNHSDKLFDTTKSDNQGCYLVDMGFESTRIIIFEYEKQDSFRVYINNRCIPINTKDNNSNILIGAMGKSTPQKTYFYPIVGKFFKDELEFNETITEIKNSVSLFQYFDDPIYIDVNNTIEVAIQEQKNSVLINMDFGKRFWITGVTDVKSKGFKAFIDSYKECSQFRIHLEHNKSVFIIECVKNISLNLLSN